MKNLILFLFLTVFLFKNSFSCLNGETKVLKDGTFLYEDFEGNVPQGHFFYKEELEIGVKRLDSLYQLTQDLDYLSDKGLIFILLQKYDEAISLFLEIEKVQPNRYSTASNLGTAYELIGQNENALKWISKSVEIDPKSHKNSEWIHVKILEAKIKGEQFYTTKFLLDSDFGDDTIPISDISNENLQMLSDALYFQLNERISFVKPKDKIVAQLLYDLGNIAFLLGNYYDAKRDYIMAKEYGYSNQIIEIREKEIKEIIEKSESSKKSITKKIIHKKSSFYLAYILTTVVLVTLVIIFFRRKKGKSNT